jgi:hypothetical protein
MHLNEVGVLLKNIRSCYCVFIEYLTTCLDSQKPVPAEMPMEYVNQYRQCLINEEEETNQVNNERVHIKSKSLFGGSQVLPFKPYSK